METKYDWVIVGAGVVGLSVARQIKLTYPQQSILVLEKEKQVGLHASGRNSGVLHTGIFYPAPTLKARLSREGKQLIEEYCRERGVACRQVGKIILPTTESEVPTLMTLLKQGQENGVVVEVIGEQQIRELEPFANHILGQALYLPESVVIDPKELMRALYEELLSLGVAIALGHKAHVINSREKHLLLENQKINYGYFINAAGAYADVMARQCGHDHPYQVVPFRGVYARLKQISNIVVRHNLYPVPQLSLPFLGVHFTPNVDGDVFIGPSAFPAWGREHYEGWHGLRIKEALWSSYVLLKQYGQNIDHIREHVHRELKLLTLAGLVAQARRLVPSLQIDDVMSSKKIGIRPQLVNKKTCQLVMDYKIIETPDELHILNTISPGLTTSFALARWLMTKYLS